MGYWKSKVLPKIKKVFDKGPSKKAAAAEAIKSYDDSKEEIDKEFEVKKEDLKPKVLEIYEASSVEVKTVVKERTDAGLKKHSASVNKFLEELAKIEFPGSKQASEASSKFGPVLVSSTIFHVFEKVSIFIPTDPTPIEPVVVKEKEVVIEVEKKEEEEKKEEVAAPAPASAPATEAPPPPTVVVEEVKVEEVKVVETAPPPEPEGGAAPKA